MENAAASRAAGAQLVLDALARVPKVRNEVAWRFLGLVYRAASP